MFPRLGMALLVLITLLGGQNSAFATGQASSATMVIEQPLTTTNRNAQLRQQYRIFLPAITVESRTIPCITATVN
jgi:hypothetical protein